MEFLKIIKRRSFLSEVVYVVLNISLALALMIIIQTTNSLWLAFALVLLSMWRIFAVRLRFWFANIQANLVSIIVSVSYIVFLYNANSPNIDDAQTFFYRCFLTVLYIGWLLFLKPQTKRGYVVAQASIALFVGIAAIYSMTYGWWSSPVVILVGLVGYATANHVLGNYDEESHTILLSLVWGLILAEIGWLAYHWGIAYRLPIITNLLLPQISVVMLCIGFLAYKSYDSYAHHQKVRLNDIILPLLFSVSIISVLLLVFNGVSNGVV